MSRRRCVMPRPLASQGLHGVPNSRNTPVPLTIQGQAYITWCSFTLQPPHPCQILLKSTQTGGFCLATCSLDSKRLKTTVMNKVSSYVSWKHFLKLMELKANQKFGLHM